MFLLSIIFDWKSSLWILRRGNHFKKNKNTLLIIQVSLFHKKTCHCTVLYCETKHEGYIAMILVPFANEVVPLYHYSIFMNSWTHVKDAWKVQNLIQTGNRSYCIVFPHLKKLNLLNVEKIVLWSNSNPLWQTRRRKGKGPVTDETHLN